MNKNMRELDCLIHGPYRKFITDESQKCPYCEQSYEREQAAKKLQETSVNQNKRLYELVTVSVDCNEHGTIDVKVPTFLSQSVKCPICAKNERKNEIKDDLHRAIKNEVLASGVPMMGIDRKYHDLDLSRSEKQVRIVERLKNYIIEITKAGTSKGAKNILFSGNMGTGKTLLASILLQNIVCRSLVDGIEHARDIRFKGGLACFFITEAALKDAIAETWGNNAKETHKQLIERLASKAILCIDDVGVSTLSNTLLDAYNQLIDERYKRKLPTIFTSNLKHDDLKQAIGARAADRFFEDNRCVVFNFDWQGYRSSNQSAIEMF